MKEDVLIPGATVEVIRGEHAGKEGTLLHRPDADGYVVVNHGGPFDCVVVSVDDIRRVYEQIDTVAYDGDDEWWDVPADDYVYGEDADRISSLGLEVRVQVRRKQNG